MFLRFLLFICILLISPLFCTDLFSLFQRFYFLFSFRFFIYLLHIFNIFFFLFFLLQVFLEDLSRFISTLHLHGTLHQRKYVCMCVCSLWLDIFCTCALWAINVSHFDILQMFDLAEISFLLKKPRRWRPHMFNAYWCNA